MPKFQVWGNNIAEVVAHFSNSVPPSRGGSNTGRPKSILEFFPQEKLMGTKFFYEKSRPPEFKTFSPEEQKELVTLVADQNPFALFQADEAGRYVASADRPETVVVSLDADPAPLGVRATPDVALEIQFADDGARAAQHRAPGRHGQATFKTRTAALHRLGAHQVQRPHAVHLFVVDQGMDAGFINGLYGPQTHVAKILAQTANGPMPQPSELPLEHRHRYRTLPNWHAHMVMRNVMACAGDNWGLNEAERPLRVYDVPVLPDRVTNVEAAATALTMQMQAISHVITTLPPMDHKVIVNAWGVKSRLHETPLGGVTESPHHPLNLAISALAALPRTVVVFAAGNNGAFSMDPETTPLDRGAGRSIWLPAGLPLVWNTGACDADGLWIGTSSQGPAGWSGAIAKDAPGFVLPSYFCETADAHILNTGSSASCGLLAGMIAAHHRAKTTSLNKPTAGLNAKKRGFSGHSNRLGCGTPQMGALL